MANSVTVTTDDAGGFRIDDMSAGKLLVETRALPRVTVRGITLQPGAEANVRVPTGLGDCSVTGTVLESAGSPVQGAKVYVSWTRREGGLQSHLYGESVTDAGGQYRLSGVGPGELTVFVSTPGRRSARRSVRVDLPGSEMVVDVELTDSPTGR